MIKLVINGLHNECTIHTGFFHALHRSLTNLARRKGISPSIQYTITRIYSSFQIEIYNKQSCRLQFQSTKTPIEDWGGGGGTEMEIRPAARNRHVRARWVLGQESKEICQQPSQNSTVCQQSEVTLFL